MSELANQAEIEPQTADEPQFKTKEWFIRSHKWAAGAELPLMTHLGRTTHLVMQKLEGETKLSFSQIRILFEALDPKGVSQSFLGKRHKVDPASITRTVQGMERNGLVTRQPDAQDNRLMRVYITEKGRAIIEAMPPHLQRFEQELVEGWTEAEILQFHAMLDRIEQRLDINQYMERYKKERETN